MVAAVNGPREMQKAVPRASLSSKFRHALCQVGLLREFSMAAVVAEIAAAASGSASYRKT
jgi:hypothetical protein